MNEMILWQACCQQCTYKSKPMDARDLVLMRKAAQFGQFFCPVCAGDQWRYATLTIVEEEPNDDQKPNHVSGREIL